MLDYYFKILTFNIFFNKYKFYLKRKRERHIITCAQTLVKEYYLQ